MEEKIKSRTSLFTGKTLILGDKKGTTATPTDAFDFQKWKNSSLDPAGVLKMHIFFGMSHHFHKSMAAASVIFRSSGQTCQYMEPTYVIEGLGSHQATILLWMCYTEMATIVAEKGTLFFNALHYHLNNQEKQSRTILMRLSFVYFYSICFDSTYHNEARDG